MKKLSLTIIIGLSLFATTVTTVAAMAEDDQTSGPAVEIKPNKRHTIEEFRSHGRLYMIKVTPTKGRPYYLIDADGDGDMETRRNDLSPNLLIPSWVLFSW